MITSSNLLCSSSVGYGGCGLVVMCVLTWNSRVSERVGGGRGKRAMVYLADWSFCLMSLLVKWYGQGRVYILVLLFIDRALVWLEGTAFVLWLLCCSNANVVKESPGRHEGVWRSLLTVVARRNYADSIENSSILFVSHAHVKLLHT